MIMLRKMYFRWLSFFLVAVTVISCTKKMTPAANVQIDATVYSPYIPVLKGVAANPIIRIAVSIPNGGKDVILKKLHCTINTSALQEVDSIQVFLTNAEPFSAMNRIASITPVQENFDIPISLTQPVGLKFIWLSVLLKKNAPLESKIDFRCTKIEEDNGHQFTINQSSSSFTKNTGVAIRKAGDEGVNTYRIPGIIKTDNGTLIAVYDIRYNNSADLPANIDVGMSRSTDNGATWEPMKIIMDMGAPHENNGIGDPAILYDPKTKKIIVAALWSKGNRSIAGSLPGLSPDTTGQFVITSSEDDGITWSTPYSITPQIKNPAWHLFFAGPGTGIAMSNGTLVFPAQYWNETKIPYSTIIYSTDHGATWTGKINGPKSNTTESQVAETTPGTLMLNMRDNRGAYRSVATTVNMGATWTEHATSYNALPDPVCMGSFIKASAMVNGSLKDVLFFSNPNTSNGRTHITIKASTDYGQSWPSSYQSLIDERLCYGYSSLVKINDHTLGILYEGIKDLYFVKVPVTDIIK